MAMMNIFAQIKTDNVLAYVSKKFFTCYNIKHIMGKPRGQATTEKLNNILKDMLNKQKGVIKVPRSNCIIPY